MGNQIKDPIWRAKVAARCHEAYSRTIDPIRVAARAQGYAIAVHGSVSRDIDLVAIPWIPEAVEPHILAEAVRRAIEDILGFADYDSGWKTNGGNFTLKPHGRKACSIIIGGGAYFDLSVVPRLENDNP